MNHRRFFQRFHLRSRASKTVHPDFHKNRSYFRMCINNFADRRSFFYLISHFEFLLIYLDLRIPYYNTFFSGFFDKNSILLFLYKTSVLLKAKSYPHNSQLFLWKVGITFENNAILPFFHNLSVENDFGLIFHFFTIYYKFVHFADSQFFLSAPA